MKRSVVRSPFVETPNKWIYVPEDVWVYGDYKCVRLSVRKTDEGKYVPTANGSPNVRIENWDFLNNDSMFFDTLEEAQNHLFKYVDNIRAREAAEFEKIQQLRKQLYATYLQTTATKV